MLEPKVPDGSSTRTSRAGLVLAAVYLLLATLLFHEALTCVGWVCDLVSLPVVLPFGWPIAWLTDRLHGIFPIPGHTVTAHLRNWYFILPTALANTLFYYWLGRQLERLVRRLLRRGVVPR